MNRKSSLFGLWALFIVSSEPPPLDESIVRDSLRPHSFYRTLILTSYHLHPLPLFPLPSSNILRSAFDCYVHDWHHNISIGIGLTDSRIVVVWRSITPSPVVLMTCVLGTHNRPQAKIPVVIRPPLAIAGAL